MEMAAAEGCTGGPALLLRGCALWRNTIVRLYCVRIFGARSFLVLCCLILVAACHVQLVSDYDEEFVKTASEIQREIDTLLQNQRNPPKGADLSYEANTPAYYKIEVELSSLLALAQSHENNDASIDQVKALIETVHQLEAIHERDNRIPPAAINIEQNTIRTQISSIVRTENAKKAGR